jgi:DNA-binding NtrC family response regulator
MESILVVDDEPEILSRIRLYLQDEYNIVTAQDGDTALKLFWRDMPPVVVTDIRMPGMNGIELLKRIKEISRSAEVIMLTALTEVEIAIDSVRNGGADYLVKPLDICALHGAIQRALEREARYHRKARLQAVR